jgi:hypothetical protein
MPQERGPHPFVGPHETSILIEPQFDIGAFANERIDLVALAEASSFGRGIGFRLDAFRGLSRSLRSETSQVQKPRIIGPSLSMVEPLSRSLPRRNERNQALIPPVSIAELFESPVAGPGGEHVLTGIG